MRGIFIITSYCKRSNPFTSWIPTNFAPVIWTPRVCPLCTKRHQIYCIKLSQVVWFSLVYMTICDTGLHSFVRSFLFSVHVDFKYLINMICVSFYVHIVLVWNFCWSPSFLVPPKLEEEERKLQAAIQEAEKQCSEVNTEMKDLERKSKLFDELEERYCYLFLFKF